MKNICVLGSCETENLGSCETLLSDIFTRLLYTLSSKLQLSADSQLLDGSENCQNQVSSNAEEIEQEQLHLLQCMRSSSALEVCRFTSWLLYMHSL